jgi:diguanylate cyclase
MLVPLVHFDCRLVILSSFIVIIAAYVTLAVVDRMKTAQGMAWFAWLGGGAFGIGVGIWLMHYFGWRALTMTVPTLERSAVICSILATIFNSGPDLACSKWEKRLWAKGEGREPMSNAS